MRSDRDLQIMLAMQKHGGSFVAALGAAWIRADDENSQKLKETFPEYWRSYADLVDATQRREGA